MALNTLDIFMAKADKTIQGLPEGRKPIKKDKVYPKGESFVNLTKTLTEVGFPP